MKQLVLVGVLIVGISLINVEGKTFPRECGNPFFSHKTLTEIGAMTPEERMDQMVLEQMFHLPAFSDDNYDLLHNYLVQDGIKVLPKAIEYTNKYDPTVLECHDRNDVRLLTSAIYINLIDSANVRLRGVESGRAAIISLELAIKRRADFDDKSDQYERRTRLLTALLNQVKGRSIKDGLIQHALKKHHNIALSNSELTEFVDFLIKHDPKYPSWTHVEGFAEISLEESARYFQAYQKFTKTKKRS
jgi:hypothetical protein